MSKNVNYGKLNAEKTDIGEYAPSVVIKDNSAIFAPTAEDYLTADDGPWKLLNVSYPTDPAGDGKHWEDAGFDETETSITKKWKAVDNPKVYRKFSKLKLYGAIAQLGAWDTIKSWLESKTISGVNGWVAFQLAQEISEEHALFEALADEARQILGLTTDQFDAFLAQCILDN